MTQRTFPSSSRPRCRQFRNRSGRFDPATVKAGIDPDFRAFSSSREWLASNAGKIPLRSLFSFAANPSAGRTPCPCQPRRPPKIQRFLSVGAKNLSPLRPRIERTRAISAYVSLPKVPTTLSTHSLARPRLQPNPVTVPGTGSRLDCRDDVAGFFQPCSLKFTGPVIPPGRLAGPGCQGWHATSHKFSRNRNRPPIKPKHSRGRANC